MPSPPWELARAIGTSACVKRSNTEGRISGAMPTPLSATAIMEHAALARWATSQADAPAAGGVNLPALCSRLPITCEKAARRHRPRAADVAGREPPGRLREAWSRRAPDTRHALHLAGRLDHVGERHRAALEHDLALRVMRETSRRSSTRRDEVSHLAAHQSRGRARALRGPRTCAGSPPRCGWERAGCAARARASRGTRPCDGRRRADCVERLLALVLGLAHAQQRPHVRHQLLGLDGRAEVAVGAGVERGHAGLGIDVRSRGLDHDDLGGARVGLDLRWRTVSRPPTLGEPSRRAAPGRGERSRDERALAIAAPVAASTTSNPASRNTRLFT